MYMVLALSSGGSLLILLWAGVTNRERSLVVHLLVLSLTCLSRVVKSLFNCCLLPYQHVWYSILWSLSYAFETTALGMFVVHWYLTLSQTKNGFKKEVAAKQWRLLFFFSVLGATLSALSAVTLHFFEPLSDWWEVITLFNGFMCCAIAFMFLYVSYALRKQLESMINPTLEQRLNLDMGSRSEAVKELTQVIQYMWFAGRVVMLCYTIAAFAPLSHYLMPRPEPGEGERIQLAIMGVVSGTCVLISISVMHAVVLPSVLRAVRVRKTRHEDLLDWQEEPLGQPTGSSGSLTMSESGLN